jgi:5-methylcytosine-specific restriction endonuclease McrA
MTDDPHGTRAATETLAIPPDVRDLVDARDGRHCRVCGRFLGSERALHHITYGGDDRGMGGRRVHDPDDIVTVCWMWRGNCHDRVHQQKKVFQPLLKQVIHRPGITVLQMLRWNAKQK